MDLSCAGVPVKSGEQKSRIHSTIKITATAAIRSTTHPEARECTIHTRSGASDPAGMRE
jgi:hypothetical protein